MKLRTRVVLQLAALCFVLAAYSFAADNAHLYIVHGIPGRDIADNLNPGLPIDVLINGTCLARGLTFDNTSGPLSFPPEPMTCRSATPTRWHPAQIRRSSTRR
ncbi:MAG: hypothetical protein WBP65_00705 [Candidatus Sulfotelmatobacter sp.]|jgi:hypothetical protein